MQKRTYKNNYRRRAQQQRQRMTTPNIKKEQDSPVTIGMIIRILLMIITAGLFSGK